MKKTAFLAKEDIDYANLNLKRSNPEIWEDGMRTDGGKGNFEWWYFDAHLHDGSKVVIIFYTKPMTDINKPIQAYATFNVDYEDGSKLERYLPSSKFEASKQQCDVTIGECTFKGDLSVYKIYMKGYNNFECNLEFTATAESWRPETGHINFGNNGKHFGWVVAVPKGDVKIEYTIDDKTIKTEGTCYHDHNWGNISLHKVINHWYWSRSEFGPYTIISSQIIPEKEYGSNAINLIYIVKDGIKIADNAEYFEVFKNHREIQEVGKKPMSNELIYSYKDENIKFNLHLIKEKNIIATYLIQQEFKRKLAKFLTGFNGAYYRITGDGILTISENNEPSATYKNNSTIWELMYFGKPL